jgi:hypothetical protein
MQGLLVVLLLAFTACASGAAPRATSTTLGAPRVAGPDEPTESDVICAEEVRTGTNLEKRICRSQVERDQDKRAAQELYLQSNLRPRSP